MGQFKPMVKMMTTEPSVILKLKKGGKVAKKMDGGYMPMQSTMPAQAMPARGGLAPAASPMAPSMAARRRAMMAKPAMNPNMMKKGGKAMKHEDAAEDRAMIKKAMAGKKFASGGSITASMAKTTVSPKVASKFLQTDMETADRTTKAKGTGAVKNGNGGGYADGGTVSQNVASKFVQTKMGTADRTTTAKGTGGVKNGNGGGYANGGTIKGGSWENRPADTAKAGKSGGTTGGVRNGNAGGYKKGGSAYDDNREPGSSGGDEGDRKAAPGFPGYDNSSGSGGDKRGGAISAKGRAIKKAYATGGLVNDGRAVAMPKKHLSQPVANSLQSGTFKKGGKVSKYRDGDSVESDPTPSNSSNMRRMAKGGKAEKEEKPNLRLIKTYTGPKGHVAKVYKDRDWQEYRTKFYTPEGKHLTEGDSHTDDAEDAHHTAQSEVNKARYAKGGKAKKYADGDLVDASKGQYDKSIGPSKEDMDMAKTIRNIPSKLYEGAKSLMGMTPKPAGSVTKTEKSVTVSPASKKRGGRC